MNKSVIMCLIALCLSCFYAQAQRYLPGQKGIQFTAGTVNGFTLDESNPNFAAHAGLAFSTYTKSGDRWVFGGEFLGKCHRYKSWCNPQMQFTGEGGYYLNVLSDRSKTIFCSAGLSALAGYETIRHNKKPLLDGATINNKDAFLYGGAITLETEIFVTDWLVLLANIRERALAGSSVGLFNTQFGLGVKFIIN
ncbi:conjugal transfer protein [Bacteroidia bacterium]|nr:conjugal transfer protein [Bacteroidia bacterium]GHT03180.1 conjugal transfer protein [Bacteroidia bacterium]GHT11664.1 conjugal transfer protein [Bacteroidia bacterium]GHT44994.1 conjugal transfer protein [Bacteroidia bacterium]GHV71805.1 conjugal transfer protein [Bacteroidia bacterium]